MKDFLPYAVFVACAIGMIAGVIAGFRITAGLGRRRRGAAWREFAEKRGLRYEGKDATLVPVLELLEGLSSPDVEHVVRWDDFALIAYTFENDGPTPGTLLFADAAALRLPPFFLTGETWVHKAFVSGQDIDFLDDRAFSSRYHLVSSDEAAVRALFTPFVRAEFLTLNEDNCRINCIDSKLLFSHSGRTNVAGLESFVDQSTRIYRQFARISASM